jgi:hypothetical protein
MAGHRVQVLTPYDSDFDEHFPFLGNGDWTLNQGDGLPHCLHYQRFHGSHSSLVSDVSRFGTRPFVQTKQLQKNGAKVATPSRGNMKRA